MRRQTNLLGLIAIFAFTSHATGQLVYRITTLADGVYPAPPGSFRAGLEFANRNARVASPQNRIILEFDASLAEGTVHLVGTPPWLYASWTTLTVAGSNPARRVTIECTQASAALLASADGLIYENIRFSYGGNVTGSGDTVMLIGCMDARLSRCEFVEGHEFGLTMVGSLNALIEDCFWSNNGKPFGGGLLVQDGCDGLTVVRGTFVNHRQGAAGLASIANVTFRDCLIQDNGTGVLFAEVCRNVNWGPNNRMLNNKGTGVSAELPVTFRVFDSIFDRNGYVTGEPQLAFTDGIDVELARTAVQNGGGVGVIAHRTLRLGFDRATVTGNAYSGLQLEQQTALLRIVDSTIAGNSRNSVSPQALISDSGVIELRRNHIAAGPGGGVLVRDSEGITISDANVFEDLGGTAVHVQRSRDVSVGPRDPWDPTDGGNVIRRIGGAAVHFEHVPAGRIGGGLTAAGKWSFYNQLGMGLVVTGDSPGCQIGPANQVQGGTIGVLARSPVRDLMVRDTNLADYVQNGLLLDRVDGAEIVRCGFVGHPGSGSGVEILSSQRVQLFGNVSRNNGSAGFHLVESPGLHLGPGNLAWQNANAGFWLESNVRAPMTLQSCTAWGQLNGGSFGFLFLGVDATMVNCTSARNVVGLSAQRNARVAASNTILWGNTSLDRHESGATASLTRCIYDPARSQGSFTDSENRTSSANNYPRFADLNNGDLHLMGDSPAIDAGSNTPAGGLPPGDLDMEGRVRRGGGGDHVDIGADEAALAAPALELQGEQIRSRAVNTLDYSIDLGQARAFSNYVMLISFAGTSPGVQLSPTVRLAMNPDAYTFWAFQTPAMYGIADGAGGGRFSLTVPPAAMTYLPPELTAVCLTLSPLFATNPVVVRFIQ